MPSGFTTPTNYDADPAAIAWARAKLQRSVDRLRDFERQAIEKGAPERVERWRRTAKWIEWQILGTGKYVVTIQRDGGVTPAEKIAALTAQVEAMTSAAGKGSAA